MDATTPLLLMEDTSTVLKKKDSTMPEQCVNLTQCNCNKGSNPTLLLSSQVPSVRIEGKMVATTKDLFFMGSFGTCKITGVDCLYAPADAWAIMIPGVLIGDLPPLASDSSLQCITGGTIDIVASNQACMGISPLLAGILGRLIGLLPRGNGNLVDNLLKWANMQQAADQKKYATEGEYYKCNEFVADAFRQIFGVDLIFHDPPNPDRPPVVGELAQGDQFTDQLTSPQSIKQAQLGDMVLWYDRKKDVNHSAILTSMPSSDPDTWQVTYAGSNEEAVKVNTIGKMFQEEGVDPVVRRPK